MKQTVPLTAAVTLMLAGTAFAADDRAPMSLGYAQQESGKSVEEVKAADVNGDKHIDAAEFAALTIPTKEANPPAAE